MLKERTHDVGSCGALFGLLAALSLGGCAGQQKKDSASGPSAESAFLPEDASAVLKAAPKGPEASVSSEQREDFEKAVAIYDKLRAAGPLKGGDCSEAADAFRRVADRAPDLLIARHNEAAIHFSCGRAKEAERIWEELGRKSYAPALAQLGYVAWQSGQTSQAESYFTRAIQEDPQLPSISARINLAQILRDRARRASAGERQKYNNDAVTHLRAVLALDGNSLQAYATLCYIYYDLGLPDAAILIGRQATKKAEEIATGKFDDDEAVEIAGGEETSKGGGRGRKGEKDEGPKRITVRGTGWTPEMKKQIALVHNTLGLVELDKKRYSQAIGSFKKAVELDPELHESRLNLAALSLKFRDYPTAEANFRAVMAAQPRNYEALIGLGVALRGARKYEEAEQQYLAAQQMDPQRPESYFNLGLLYQEYKGSDKPTLQKAQQYYREFVGRAAGSDSGLKRDAQKRIKDIDELFVALEEAQKLQREAEELQRKAEEQQKKMEEEMRRQEQSEAGAKAPTGASVESPPAGGASAPPAVTPPPAP